MKKTFIYSNAILLFTLTTAMALPTCPSPGDVEEAATEVLQDFVKPHKLAQETVAKLTIEGTASSPQIYALTGPLALSQKTIAHNKVVCYYYPLGGSSSDYFITFDITEDAEKTESSKK